MAKSMTEFGGTMKFLGCRPVRKHISGLLVVMLAASWGEAAASPQQQAGAQQQPIRAQQTQSVDSGAAPQPDSEGEAATPSVDAPQPQQASPPQAAPQSIPSGTPQSEPEQQQSGGNNPVGTAAAPYEKPSGVAASRPAGAVIAPAKQRRVRSFLIKMGVVVGAGVAVGTVLALSHGSPSRPN
jgi:hypothetical protein